MQLKSKKGQKFKITDIQGKTFLVERLHEMGFYNNKQVEFLGQAPFSGPYLLSSEGTIIALRQEEFLCLNLEII